MEAATREDSREMHDELIARYHNSKSFSQLTLVAMIGMLAQPPADKAWNPEQIVVPSRIELLTLALLALRSNQLS